MPQSKAEAERLMEQQHYGGDYISPQDAGLVNPDSTDEEQEDEAYWYEHVADLCANCAHMRESHVNYTEDCSEANCECLHFEEPE
jgi:hypothetical protein